MTTYRLTIEYDGTHFSGWQLQPGEIRTVQGELEEALATVLRERTPIQGASRTDAGVHALGQVASFVTETEIEPRRIARSLSGLAGPEIAVVDAAVAPDAFNARFDAEGKRYRYRIQARPALSPLFRSTAHHVPGGLDLESMRAAAATLVGEHDFAGFRAADCERETTVRNLNEISISSSDDGIVDIDVSGTAFLKYMVRILAGTLIEVGRGRMSLETIDEILETGDRRLAGPTAPARGLTLLEVLYPAGWLRDRDRKKNGAPREREPRGSSGP